MTLDPKAAAATLGEIDAIGKMVRQSAFYRRASLIMILWGALVALGNLATWASPRQAGTVWTAVYVVGFAGHIALGFLDRRNATPPRPFQWRVFTAFFLFFAFGVLWSQGVAHFDGRQMSVFWPTYFMLAYILVGLWAGMALIVIGGAVTALTLFGFVFISGPWFEPWMALVNGGGLVLGGLWMRRA